MCNEDVKFTSSLFDSGEYQGQRYDQGRQCGIGTSASQKPLLQCIVAIVLLVIVAGSATAAIINEPMNNAAAPGWVMGGSAYLTASTGVDSAGSGWLRLTEPAANQAGFAMLDSSFDISQGVVIQFEYATWGGNGADGYSIFLFDGSYDASTFAVGASGGSLGYDKKTVAPVHAGLTGGYIGVGIDEYGNFSNPTEGRSGGPGLRANSVAVRGPFNHPTAPYYYIGGTAANVGTLWFNQAYRPVQTGSAYRKVVIYLTPVAAPNYMRVDVYLQFGYNQPLTQVLTGLNTGVQIPTTVKVGYAASTGGSTNYHEIRNLTIDPLPTDINLGISKTVSTPTVAPGDVLTYTVSARNYGPVVTTVSDVPVTDTMPQQLTGVTWACNGSNGGICGAASGSGSLNTVATLPFNGAAIYTISGTVDPATPPGTVIINTASLSAPAGIIDYSPADNSASVATTVSSGTVTVAGTVFNDSGTGGGIPHNGVQDGGETGLNAGLTYYAKIFRSSDLSTTIAPPAQVNTTTGAYSFSGIPAYGSYTIILSSTATADLYDPGFPNANWVSVTPPDLALNTAVTAGANLANQNFFLYNGSRISGKVIRDDGFNGSVSNVYDGILNGAETGIAGVTMTLRDDGNTVTYDSSTTGSNGSFTLYTNVASATLRIYETNPAGFTSVSYNPGTTAGTYTIAGEYLRFAYTLYTDYSGAIFGDVPQINLSFTPVAASAGGTPAAPVYHAHTFAATGRGSVTFAATGRTQTAWPAVAYVLDSNCNGNFDTGEPDISAAINVAPNQNICILARVTIPAGAVPGTGDQLVTRASFTAGLAPPAAIDVTGTTSVTNYPSSGNIPLYLYDSTSTPSWKLSRTVNISTTGYATINTTTPQTWAMNPVAASAITIDPAVSATVPVILNMRRGTSNGNRTIKVNLQCSSGGTVLSQSQTLNMNTTQTAYTFSLPLVSSITCGQGAFWNLTVSQTSGTDSTRIYPYSATVGSASRVVLPATTVINVDSTRIYDAAYAGGSQLASATLGSTVHIRSVVSDPFGSYVIFPAGGTAPTLTIRDPSGTVLVSAAAMTLVATGSEAPSLTKTFEYAYTIPAAPLGNWSLLVTAAEGTEGTVINSRYTAMTVVPPVLTLTIIGSGSVHGTSTLGQSYACDGGACPATPFAYNDQVTLTATGSNSTFSAWSGDYAGSSNPGNFAMDRNRVVTATFTPDPARVRIDGDLTPYYAIDTALAVPSGAATVRAQSAPDFIENVVMANPVPIIFKGGYSDAAFTSQAGYSTVTGSVQGQGRQADGRSAKGKALGRHRSLA